MKTSRVGSVLFLHRLTLDPLLDHALFMVVHVAVNSRLLLLSSNLLGHPICVMALLNDLLRVAALLMQNSGLIDPMLLLLLLLMIC